MEVGTILGAGYNIKGQSPLDVRLVQDTLADLQSICNTKQIYPGALVYVKSEEKYYKVVEENSILTYEVFTAGSETADFTYAQQSDIDGIFNKS